VTAAVVLVLPGAAHAGGWATLELSSTPDGVRAGQEWVVDLKVLQHGRTPLEDATPSVTISRRGTDVSRKFAAHKTGQAGVYRATVVFPNAGDWKYAVDDGFTQVHAYPAVRIAPEAQAQAAPARQTTAAGRDGGFPWEVAAALAIGLAAAVMTLALQRRRMRAPSAAGRPPATTSG
jgi:hypothetical protein